MSRLAAGIVAVLLAMSLATAYADDGDSARIAPGAVLIGQQRLLVIEVVTAAGASVEVDPVATSWNGVEVIRLQKEDVRPAGDRAVHRIELLVAPFRTGALAFSPAVNVVDGGIVTPRVLPEVKWSVTATLPPGARLELSPIAAPRGIEGAESPMLRPAIAFGAVAVVALVAGGGFGAARWWRRRPRREREAGDSRAEAPDLARAAELLERDPVAAYRSLAATVRSEIGTRHGFPAMALTTRELKRRMEGHGVERWNARLIGGLLEECDAVVYAGYRPAFERRQADLTMAREIIEGRG
jgi:hypothetical protein